MNKLRLKWWKMYCELIRAVCKLGTKKAYEEIYFKCRSFLFWYLRMVSFVIERRWLVQCWPSPGAGRKMMRLVGGLSAKCLLEAIIFAIIYISPLKQYHWICMNQFWSIRKILTEPHPGKWNCIDLNGGIGKSSIHSNSMMPSMGFLVVVVRVFDLEIEHLAEMVAPDRPVDYLSGL